MLLSLNTNTFSCIASTNVFLASPLISFSVAWIAAKLNILLQPCAASVDAPGITWATSIGLIFKSWNQYLISSKFHSYPWSHRTLLKLLFSSLPTNASGASVIGKWGTKQENRLRLIDSVSLTLVSLAKIIVSKSTQLQYLWRLTLICNNMELTYLPQICLYILLVYRISYIHSEK